jgi:Histone methylation protein DOT1
MVHYEPSPARVVLDLIDHAGLRPDDVLYDLGSGLGYAVILVRLAGGIAARGVELQQSYNDVARRCASDLGLTSVDVITADVRDADLSDGTVFYLFTPFRGQIMRDMLDHLRTLAAKRPITVCTYGSCTRVVAAESWLAFDDPAMLHEYKLGVFRSRPRPPTPLD